MSTWIKEIQERAETVLNKIDQNAAVALQEAGAVSNEETTMTDSIISIDVEAGISDYKVDNTVFTQLTEEKVKLEELLRSQKDELSKSQHQINQLIEEITRRQDETYRLTNDVDELKTTNSAQNKAIAELESSLVKVRQEYIELNEQFFIRNREITKKAEEYESYKRKAQLSLQEKDNIIKNIRNSEGNASSADSTELKIELESMKFNYSKLEEDLKYLESKNKKLDIIVENQKITFENHKIQWSDREKKLKENYSKEQTKALHFENKCNVMNHELNSVREELEKQRVSSNLRLHEKEEEIKQNYLHSQPKSSHSYSSNDMRLKSLTETLVEKQNTVEVLTAEKNALKLQLENMEYQIKNVKKNAERNVVINECINLNDTDDGELVLLVFITSSFNYSQDFGEVKSF